MLMNLQSNALKFTKEGGKIQIICEFVKASGSSSKKKKTGSKIVQKMFEESYSSTERKNNSDQSDESHNSEAKRFEKEHNVEGIF